MFNEGMEYYSNFEREINEFLETKKNEYILQIVNGTNINNFEEYKNIQGRLASVLLMIDTSEEIHDKLKKETRTF